MKVMTSLFEARLKAKRNLFQCNFDYKDLFIKINRKNIVQTI